MKFADKWKELENIILSEVTQTQKDKHGTINHSAGKAKIDLFEGSERNVDKTHENFKGNLERIRIGVEYIHGSSIL
ncbi:hypothetical protein STEG23_008652 [Scotinomys teguina]